MKIITITLNPALDKTIYVNDLKKGNYNHITESVLDAGGKGINVSKTLLALGQESVSLAFIGKNNGNMLEEKLKAIGLKTDFIIVADETRTNIKVVEENRCVTEFNEPGPRIKEEELEEFIEKVENYADSDTWFVISGSMPRGVPVDFYATLIRQIHKNGGKILLDTSKDAFKEGVKASPNIIKPNLEELKQYYHKEEMSMKEIIAAGEEFLTKGIEVVVISLGEQGALFLTKECYLYGKGLKVKANSTIGAGDAMVAALIYSKAQKYSFTKTAKLAMAVSAGAVMTKGTNPAKKELVEELLEEVEIQRDFFWDE